MSTVKLDEPLMFYAIDRESLKKRKKSEKDATPHRSLIEYGRRIFRLCLTSVLSSATQAQIIGLPGLLVHNRERIEALCKILNQKDVPPVTRLLEARRLVNELQEFSTDVCEANVEVRSVLGATRLLLATYKETEPALSAEAEEGIKSVVSRPAETALKELGRIEQCASCLRDALRAEDTSEGQEILTVVLTFLDYVTNAGFKLRCFLEEKQGVNDQSKGSTDE